MKIGLVIFADFPGGAAPARRIHVIARAFTLLGHRVCVIVPQRFTPGPLHETLDGFDVHWGFQASHQTWNRLVDRLAARIAANRLVDRFAKEGMDWLLLSNPTMDGLPMLATARRHGTRIMAMYDDIRDIPRKPSVEDRLRLIWMESADKLIPKFAQLNLVISSLLEMRISSVASRTPIFTLPPLVDTDVFQPDSAKASEFRAKWRLQDEFVISYLGTYWHHEGIAVLLQAARHLRNMGDQFKVVISGASYKGLDCDDVPLLINELGLHDVVIETGWLPLADVISAMSAADVLVVPKVESLINAAGISTKLPEYLAMERPVVASSLGEYPRYLTHGHDALLCEPSDAESLAAALHKLIHNQDLRQHLSANARATAKKHFDSVQVISKLTAKLKEIAES